MKSVGRTGVALIVGFVLFGCAAADRRFGDNEMYKKTREISGKAVTATKSTASASYKRMQKYLGEKDLLKTFHDTGEHSEAAVLEVLHKSGIGRRAPPAAKSSGATKAPSTAKTPGTSAPKTGTPKTDNPKAPAPATPADAHVPEQYAGDYCWPLDAGIVSSEYGERWGKMHKGIDIAADTGEPVHAVAAGQVIYAGDGLRGYGNVVILKHDNKLTSLYAHNSELKVKQGDEVKQGSLIALLGSTGHSTGPHVHFEFREGDVAVNPHTLLPKSKIPDAVATREPATKPNPQHAS
jgi:murein DD-endopeptidase MepM/ murein hydrolase activator NlpD